jgi:hypothetical protein
LAERAAQKQSLWHPDDALLSGGVPTDCLVG